MHNNRCLFQLCRLIPIEIKEKTMSRMPSERLAKALAQEQTISAEDHEKIKG